MPQFNPGDRVRRLPGEDHGIVVAGNIYIVVSHYGNNLQIEGDLRRRYSADKFELVVEEPVAPIVPQPREFQVGDRVRFLRDNPSGGRGFGHAGDFATVVTVRREWLKVNLDIDRGHGDFQPNVPSDAVELVAEVVPEPGIAAGSSLFWTVVYKTRNIAGRQIMGFDTEAKAMRKKNDVLANGGQVFGMKKITLRGV